MFVELSGVKIGMAGDRAGSPMVIIKPGQEEKGAQKMLGGVGGGRERQENLDSRAVRGRASASAT